MIIKFPTDAELVETENELKHTSYIDVEGDLGVSTLGREFAISELNKNEFLIGDKLISREALAEFLWVAAIFVDSEKRFHPNIDLVGCNY